MTILYGFGSNSSGQLGIGHLDDVQIPQPCLGLPDDDAIIKVVGGSNHAAALTRSGHVYLSGTGQLGEKERKRIEQQDPEISSKEWARFRKLGVSSDKAWRDVACGWSFTILVDKEEGRVYGLGTARFGEFNGPQEATEPVEISGLKDIVAVACGWRHVVAIDKQGQLFGWGWGKHGQLLEQVKIRTPKQIDVPEPIVQIACGHIFSLVLGKHGKVYGFGSNKYQQLGEEKTQELVQMVDVQNISRISTGWHHCGAYSDENKRLVCWGRHDHGQTGPAKKNVDYFVCGSEHTLAVRNNTLLAWGWNEHGNCASNEESVFEPQIVPIPDGTISIIGAGCASSWVGIDSQTSA